MAENKENKAMASVGDAANTTKNTQTRDVVANQWLAELELADAVAKAAQVPERIAALEEQEVTPTFVADLLTRIGQAGDFITTIQTARSGGKGATRNEGEARNALLKAVGVIQSAARRKFARSQPERLKLYAAGGGVNLTSMNRAQLAAAIPTLIDTAKADGLSGAGDAKTDAVQAAFDAWNAFDEAQTTSGTAETTAREALKTLLLGADGKGETGLIADRRTLQYAADAAWPPGQNIAIRREFKLQDNRRFAG